MTLPYPYQNFKVVWEDSRHWWCLCCFHNEKAASFTINKTTPYHLYYRCWACGENGSPQKFAKKMGLHTNPIIERFVAMRREERPVIDWSKRLNNFGNPCYDYAIFNYLGLQVGVSHKTIEKFNIGYNKGKFLIPMHNENGICGIQERWYENGVCKKKCQRYSKHGIFLPLPWCYNSIGNFFICEGFSDAATMTELKYSVGLDCFAIGRFNALSIDSYILKIAQHQKAIYIVTDNDEIGIKGAKKLQKLIPNSKIIYPWHIYKDIRDMYLREGKNTKKWIESQL